MTVIIMSALAMTQIAATQFALTQTAMIEIAKWDSFYVIVGSAAGALIGLQFVVLTLIAERPPTGLAEAGAAFGSPTIVHFGAVLFLSALLHAPWQTITIAAILWGLLGFGGVVGSASLLLLFIGIHNAWDNVAYHVLVNIAGAKSERRRDESE